MSAPAVSIHPYFKVNPGKLEAAKALLPAFFERTKTEPACLYYEFTLHEDTIFCREAYIGGEGALTHLSNVASLLEELLTMSTLERLELHGEASELEKLKAPLAALNPTYFVYQGGVPH